MQQLESDWRTIQEFPNYAIDQYGRVYNSRTDSIMRTSPTNHGHTKITLTANDEQQYEHNPECSQEIFSEVNSRGLYVCRDCGGVFDALTGEGTFFRPRFTRSVAQLVAVEFVEAPNPLCDSVVMLDGDLSNVAATNLVWRPRWFAWKYARQLRLPQPLHFQNLRVENMTTNVEYVSIVQAGMMEGLLFADIWRSTYMGSPVYPYGHRFEITERV